MDKFLSIWILLLMASLAGCVQTTPLLPSVTPLTESSSEANESILVPSPTSIPPTEELPTATASPEFIPTATELVIPTPELLFDALISQCLEVAENFQPNMLAEGNILFWMFEQFDILNRNLENIEPIKTTYAVSEYAVSPDRKWLAYVDEEEDARLVVISANGEEQVNLSRPATWGQLAGWLNHERLIFVPPGLPKGSILLVNPFSNEVQELTVSLLDVYESNYQPWPLLTIYNPDLTRVAYLSSEDQDGNGTGFEFWDLINQQLLWELKSRYTAVAAPVWSPDATQLMAALPTKEGVTDLITMELFSISHDGQPKQLTNLGVVYAYVAIGPHLVWSPDGRYVAFWAHFREEPSDDPFKDFPPSHLMVLDLQENHLTDYCVGGLGANNYPPSIIWSPNSKQMIVMVHRVNETGLTVSDIILVDIPNNLASKITENRVPIGWFEEMP